LTSLLLKDVLKRMQGIYKTIDLRVACFRENVEWENALTAIRFSHLKATEVRDIYDGLRRKWGGKVDTPRLKVACQALPISKYSELTKELLEGTLSLKKLTVKFEGKRDIDSWNCNLTEYPHYLRKLEKWKTFEGAISTSTDIRPKMQRVDSDAKSLGFADIYSCMNEWLQSQLSHLETVDTIFSAPVYAIIDDVDVKDLTVKVKISSHIKMARSLHLDLLQLKGRGFWGQSIEKTGELISTSRKHLIDEKSVKLDPSFLAYEANYEIPSWNLTDFPDARLIYDKVEILEIDKKEERALAKIKEGKAPATNPFFWLFDRFCDYDELINQLKDPQGVATEKKCEPSKIFERAVSWLLALCGLQAIKLDEYEKFKPKAGKSEYDSVDIIVYSNEKSLIILSSCTTGLPKLNEDVPRLLDLKKRLEEDLFKETSMKLAPVIFSSKRMVGPVKDDAAKYNVKVIDSSDAESMVMHLRDGKIQDALAFIVQ